MLRSLATRKDPVTGATSVNVARVIDAVRVVGLVIVVVTTVWLARPGPASGGARGTAVRRHPRGVRRQRGSSGCSPGPRAADDRRATGGDGGGRRRAGRAVSVQPGHRRRLRGHFGRRRPAEHRGLAGHHRGNRGGVPGAGLATGVPTETLVGYPFALIGLWAFGLTRHAYLLRAEQAERTLERGPPGARGREPCGRARRTGQDRQGDPRRSRPLARRGVG